MEIEFVGAPFTLSIQEYVSDPIPSDVDLDSESDHHHPRKVAKPKKHSDEKTKPPSR